MPLDRTSPPGERAAHVVVDCCPASQAGAAGAFQVLADPDGNEWCLVHPCPVASGADRTQDGPPGDSTAPPELAVRRAVPADAGALRELSVAAIRELAASHYAPDQVAAWSSRRTAEQHSRLIDQTATFVVTSNGPHGRIAGFVSVALHAVGALTAGEVDQMFVHPAFAGQGIGRVLLDAAEQAAADAGLRTLRAHVSRRAAGTFRRHRYEFAGEEDVDLGGVVLTRSLMVKQLRPDQHGTPHPDVWAPAPAVPAPA